ncbi:MAG: hypothetical protein GY906_18460 [bacterium]|nr:hypothetical protein [bacterium]
MATIAFITMFLGLVVGQQPVELAVSGDRVAMVEIVLDGATVGRLEAPPWRYTCDLGSELLPHELVAIARDDEGNELIRTRQWINLPRDPAEATLVVGKELEGGRRLARLVWRDIYGVEPISMMAFFDGMPLAVTDPERIILPPHDLDTVHLLRAEIQFPEQRQTTAEVLFGGGYGANVRAELTAVAVEIEKGKMPSVDAIQGWFLSDGRELPVAVVEQERSELLMVVDRGVELDLAKLLPRLPDRWNYSSFSGSRPEPLLGEEQSVQFLWPIPMRGASGNQKYALFKPTRRFFKEDGHLIELLDRLRLAGLPEGPQRLTDAVAVAGRMATRLGHPRMVILIVSKDPDDASQLSPAVVRQYLSSLQVPLVVWSPESKRLKGSAWGEVVRISTLGELNRALGRASKVLEHQRIVWIEGLHLPQQIALAQTAENLRLAR